MENNLDKSLDYIRQAAVPNIYLLENEKYYDARIYSNNQSNHCKCA